MSSSESSATPIEPPAQESTAQEERQEWVFRAIAGTRTVLFAMDAATKSKSGDEVMEDHPQVVSPSSSILGPPRKLL